MDDDKHNQKYNNYGKYLAFDCDAPPDIQAVVLSATRYESIYKCL